MKANEHQVGGRHYKTAYEHWDMTLATGMGYLEGCATKYVSRWRKKGGAEDLKKALHYLNKLDENRECVVERALISSRPVGAVLQIAVRQFSEANGLCPVERAFVECLATWRATEDLAEARQLIFQLLDEAEGVTGIGDIPSAAPVPLTEENHHAQRVGQSDEEYHRE